MATNKRTRTTDPRSTRKRWRRGFTLVSTTISFTVAGVVLAGAWMAFANMRTQWKIQNAERLMDNYGHMAMKELTNIMSWGWGAEQLGGGRYERWKTVVDDLIEEHGLMNNWTYRTVNSNQGYHFIELTYHPQRGVLWNNRIPDWNDYQFLGHSPRVFHLNDFNRQDRMTVEGLRLNLPQYRTEFPVNLSGEDNPDGIFKLRENVMEVTLTLHYTHRNSSAWGLYSGYYVRERQYRTKICLRNWDVESNPFREIVIGNS